MLILHRIKLILKTNKLDFTKYKPKYEYFIHTKYVPNRVMRTIHMISSSYIGLLCLFFFSISL